MTGRRKATPTAKRAPRPTAIAKVDENTDAAPAEPAPAYGIDPSDPSTTPDDQPNNEGA